MADDDIYEDDLTARRAKVEYEAKVAAHAVGVNLCDCPDAVLARSKADGSYDIELADLGRLAAERLTTIEVLNREVDQVRAALVAHLGDVDTSLLTTMDMLHIVLAKPIP